MIYAVYHHSGKNYYPRVDSILGKKPEGAPVVLNGIMGDQGYEKTGPYCPIRYEAPPNARAKKRNPNSEIRLGPKTNWAHNPPRGRGRGGRS